MQGFRHAAALVFVAASAKAQGLPPWVPPNHLPLAEDAKSVEIRRKDEPLYSAPNGTSSRRGAALRGARLPLYGTEPGLGCRGDWLLVGPTAWVCSDVVDVTDAMPWPADMSAPALPDGLPLDYFFVGAGGALGYRDLASADETAPAGQLEPGFAVSVTTTGKGPRGDPFGLTTKGLWLALRDLTRVRPLVFRGYDVTDGRLDRGFIVVDTASLYAEPGGKKVAGASKSRFDTVPILEVANTKGRHWLRTAGGAWLDGDDVRVPSLAAPPAEARPFERWIDVELANQIMTAYEGDVPVFATLTSTGIGKNDEVTATPLGVHRVWVKLTTTDMTNLEDQEALHYYAMEEVPWVLFFKKGYGFHGAFWHRSFGHVRSHGCVNLTPLDAERLFRWSSPRLPIGWTAALPTDYDPGTLVRVR